MTDRSLSCGTDGLVWDVAAAVAGGVNAVLVREKDLPEEQLLALARRLLGEVGTRAVVLLHGTMAVALAAGAAGIHLAEVAPPLSRTRGKAGCRTLIGRSVHSLESARSAAADGADYLLLGTVFPSRSHPGGETGGLERVRQVSEAVQLPVIGIGGITVATAADVVQAGAAGVAVISAILGKPDVQTAAAELWTAVARGFRSAVVPRRRPVS